MAAQEIPIGLWELAKLISPCRAKLCALWLGDITFTPATLERVYAEQARKYPNAKSWELNVAETDKAIERRKGKKRSLARHLFLTYLPYKVRKVLITGAYQIRGRRNGESAFIILTPDALAGLDVNLSGNQLIGATVSYQEIAVTPIHHRKGRRKGDGKYNDKPHLEKMRELIESGKVKSPNAAAGKIVSEAKGQSPGAIIQRLGKSYKCWERDGFPN